ncbi:Uncharacterised protein [Citrobacter freundii]|nr:Uncharacterised protein [Citrobacter freundii]
MPRAVHQQQDARFIDQRPGNSHTLTLPTGKLRRFTFINKTECDLIQCFTCFRVALFFINTFNHQPIGYVVEDPTCAGIMRNPEYRIDVPFPGRQFAGLFTKIVIAPPDSCSNPAIRRRQVVLPEPDGPSIEKNSPSLIAILPHPLHEHPHTNARRYETPLRTS